MNGIQSVHKQGLAHRDLKPDNLLLSNEFVLKITDFGFSTMLQDPSGNRNLRTVLGTDGYMAPEVYIGSYEGKKVDIFAAGVILFIMYSGNFPFGNAK